MTDATPDLTIDDIEHAQRAARAYLGALARAVALDTEAEETLDEIVFGMPSSVARVLEQVGELLTALGCGAPTEHDVCTALLKLKSHIYAASGRRHRLILTPSAELFAGHLFSAIYETKAEAKQVARRVDAVAWNY